MASDGGPRPMFFLDPERMPFWLYIPNLVGYVRWWTLIVAMRSEDPFSHTALWCLATSLALDFFDGPLARHFDMCTTFGDLLDHVADHVTMYYLVRITTVPVPLVPGHDNVASFPQVAASAWNDLWNPAKCGNFDPCAMRAMSFLNNVNSWVHLLIALGYMAYYRHYFKHSKQGNFVTRNIEANNYWNLGATLYAANTFLIPLVKMSYTVQHKSMQPLDSTYLLDSWDYAGMIVTGVYGCAVMMDTSTWLQRWFMPKDMTWELTTGVLRGVRERVHEKYSKGKSKVRDQFNVLKQKARDHSDRFRQRIRNQEPPY